MGRRACPRGRPRLAVMVEDHSARDLCETRILDGLAMISLEQPHVAVTDGLAARSAATRRRSSRSSRPTIALDSRRLSRTAWTSGREATSAERGRTPPGSATSTSTTWPWSNADGTSSYARRPDHPAPSRQRAGRPGLAGGRLRRSMHLEQSQWRGHCFGDPTVSGPDATTFLTSRRPGRPTLVLSGLVQGRSRSAPALVP